MNNHFLDITHHSPAALRHMLSVAIALRAQREAGVTNDPVLRGKTLAMLFEKPSLRTRVSFEQAMYELGGHAIVLGQSEVGLGQRESVADVTSVLIGMVHGIAARVYAHDKLTQMAQHANGCTIVNMLSDHSHPAQAMADALTMIDAFSPGNPAGLAGRKLVFVGDGNNVARSLAHLCAKLDMRFTLACPTGYELDEPGLDVVHDPGEAVRDADAIYCDTFVSMGQEAEKQQRLKDFADYQVNEALLRKAPPHAIALHCLPAYRGIEITDAVMDGPQSRVFPQAHNRLHAQKGILAVLIAGL